MEKPSKLKTVTITTMFTIDAELETDDILSIVADAMVQIDEAVLRQEDDVWNDIDVWTDRGDTFVTVDGVEVSRELGVED